MSFSDLKSILVNIRLVIVFSLASGYFCYPVSWLGQHDKLTVLIRETVLHMHIDLIV